MELLKLINPMEMVAQLVCFFVILALLRVFVWGKILTFLDNRTKRIENELSELELLRKEVDGLKGQYAQKIRDIDSEAQARIAAAVADGEKIARQIKGQAQVDATKTIENAQVYIRQEVVKAKEESKRSLVDLTIQATEKVIARTVSSDQDRQLVKDMVAEIERQA